MLLFFHEITSLSLILNASCSLVSTSSLVPVPPYCGMVKEEEGRLGGISVVGGKFTEVRSYFFH